jgi:hypothetical protein
MLRGMRRRLPLSLLAATVLAGGAATAATAAAHPPAAEAAPAARVLAAPSPVLGTDRQRHLVYEVELNNPTAQRATLTRAVVRDGRGTRLAAYAGARLVGLLGPYGQPVVPAPVVEPGQGLTLYLDVALPRAARVPRALEHRLRLSVAGVQPQTVVARVRTPVLRRAALRLGPPLRGAGYVTIAAHSAQTIDGRRSHSQRFALDIGQLDEARGGFFAGDPQRNESYAIHGDQVLAVASGVVARTRTDLPENTPGTEPAFDGWDTVAGNRVVLDLGGGRYALYAHLQPGSIPVRPGDRVARGQVLGRVGNSGLSTGPHLHFQVMDEHGGASALAGNGLPYVFKRFTLLGAVRDLAAPVVEPADPPAARSRQWPLSGSVVAFP